MGYVTQEYYKDSFHGEPVADEDFPVLMSRASELVEEMTLYRLSPDSYTKAGADSGTGSGCRYAPRAQRILMPTGLLYRGGGSY